MMASRRRRLPLAARSGSERGVLGYLLKQPTALRLHASAVFRQPDMGAVAGEANLRWLLAWKSRMANCKWPGIFKFIHTHTLTLTHFVGGCYTNCTASSFFVVLNFLDHLGRWTLGRRAVFRILGEMPGAVLLRGLCGHCRQRPSSVFVLLQGQFPVRGQGHGQVIAGAGGRGQVPGAGEPQVQAGSKVGVGRDLEPVLRRPPSGLESTHSALGTW